MKLTKHQSNNVVMPSYNKFNTSTRVGFIFLVAVIAALLPAAVVFAGVSFSPATNFAVGANLQSIAIGDLNGDGAPDLAVANSVDSVLLNNGSGAFSAATNFPVCGGFSVAIGDLNGDGKMDLAVGTAYNTVAVFLKDDAGTFGSPTQFPTGGSPVSVAIGDLNGDGYPDLSVANSQGTVDILLGTGTGAFGLRINFPTLEGGTQLNSVAIADLNGDGYPDLAVASRGINSVFVFLGDGTGAFGSATYFHGGGHVLLDAVVGDLNGDGKPDLATANAYSNTVGVLLGDGTGTFSGSGAATFATKGSPVSLVIGDLNGDGKPDLATANLEGTVSVLLGEGAGVLGAATTFSLGSTSTGLNDQRSKTVVIGDLNGDGKPDLAVANTGDATVSVLVNTTTPLGGQAPIAHAGTDQTIHVGNTVTLDGSGSTDPDGNTPLTYSWSFMSRPIGSIASLSDSAIVNPTFTADIPGEYLIKLVVTDGSQAASSPATVAISTTNSAPIAEAGPDKSVTLIGTLVELDGTQSYDSDGDPITYEWTLVSAPTGSTASINETNTSKPTFVVDMHGDYGIQLVVSDPWTTSSLDTVTVSFENIKPVANAGTSQTVETGNPATLDGGASLDANGDTLAYAWVLSSFPVGSLSAIENPSAKMTTLVPDLPGTYVVQLTVNDGFVCSDPSAIQIEVVASRTTPIDAVRAVVNQVAALDSNVFKNKNMQNTLLNKLNAVIANLKALDYTAAYGQLQNDIFGKTDGCVNSGAMDKNDWIKDCASQNHVYPYIVDALAEIERFL